MYEGGVLLAADTRSSSGTFVGNKVSDKLEPLHQRIYCQRTGTSAHTQYVAHLTRYYLDAHASELGELPLVHTAAKIIQSIFYNNQWMNGALIVSGWDNVKGYQIYEVTHGNCFDKKMASMGSGSYFLKSYIDKNYREGMSKREAYEFAKEAISLACFRDGSSGGCI